MRILHLCDTHLTAKNPASRLDSYYVTTVRKLYEVGMVIKRENIDMVLHDGDLFHTPKVSLKYGGIIADIMRSWGVPIHVVPGNHDIYGYNIDTLDQTMLGMFAKTGVVEILARGTILTYDIGGYELSIEGQEYYANIDKGNPADYAVVNTTADYKILAAHGMLLPKAFLPDTTYTLIQDVVTNADLVLVGHYHPGYDDVVQGKTTYCNIGSALRIEASTGNKTAVPKMQILDIHPRASVFGLECTKTLVPFASAKPGTEIFDYTTKQIKRQNTTLLNTFKTTVQNTASLQQATTIPDMVQAIAQLTNVETSVVKTALTYISNAQTVADDAIPEVKGFIEKLNRIWITRLEGKNFQSWKDINVDFTNGLNILVGESNHGKTALLRLILWVLFNDPKGTDFIRTGESEAWGKLYFSDGSSIERRRTVSNAGSYIVTDSAGNVSTYSGFNNDIPPEVMNEHQMPEVYLAKDFKVRLNVASQLDRPFLVTESPYVKASAVGRLIGTQTVDAAIKNVNADKLKADKRVKVLEKEIKQRNEDLKKYECLDDMRLFIKAYEYLLIGYDALEKHRAEMQFAQIDYIDNRLKIEKVQKDLVSTPNLDVQELLIAKASQLVSEIESLTSLQTELYNIRGEIFNVWSENQKLYGLVDCEEVIAKAEELVGDIKTLGDYLMALGSYRRQISELIDKINHQDVTNIEAVVKVATQNIGKIEEALSMASEIANVRGGIADVTRTIENLNIHANNNSLDIARVEEQIAQCLRDSGTCPTCGGVITQEHIDHIIGEV